jgi:hypothetical protein
MLIETGLTSDACPDGLYQSVVQGYGTAKIRRAKETAKESIRPSSAIS